MSEIISIDLINDLKNRIEILEKENYLLMEENKTLKQPKKLSKKDKDGIIKKIKSSENMLEVCRIASILGGPSAGSRVEAAFLRINGLTKSKDSDLCGDTFAPKLENVEIKFSTAAKDEGRLNYCQLRPTHNIQHYLLINYIEETDSIIYLLVPAKIFSDLIPNWGGYMHGTGKEHGNITSTSIYFNKGCEYALRPNILKADHLKPKKLWNLLLPFKLTEKELITCL